MKPITVGELKTNMAQIIQKILKGEEFVVSYGRKKIKVFKVIPYKEENQKRKLGILEGRATVKFAKDWKMTTKEFLGS